MKQYKGIWRLSIIFISFWITSCENNEVIFPDFDYTTVYFANQYPVRTIVLGDDIYDNTLDNEHKCKIYATMGGVYQNDKNIEIDVEVSNELCNNLYYSNGEEVLAMPSEYYSLASDKMFLNKQLQGGIEVQLTDAFFADANAIKNTYVIPLVMTDVANADSILGGLAKNDSPIRTNLADWDVTPKDYVLYCVKYINKWHAIYLRRGTDVIKTGNIVETVIRREASVEYDELSYCSTTSLSSVELPINVVNANDENVTCTLLLTFDQEDNCNVSSNDNGFAVTGSGKFVIDGEKKSWGNKDRNALYLDYTINVDGKTYSTKDTLVVRDRGIKPEYFSPEYIVK
ncbi:DUF1735 domain-containing protein [Marinilabiliaceae bacterium A049]|nr:DUF1735 domain-containing protein [Marinilabiliaceae bacterium A049]